MIMVWATSELYRPKPRPYTVLGYAATKSQKRTPDSSMLGSYILIVTTWNIAFLVFKAFHITVFYCVLLCCCKTLRWVVVQLVLLK